MFDILLTYNLTRDWTSTLEKVLPQRKAAVAPAVAPSTSPLPLLPSHTSSEVQPQEEDVGEVASEESLSNLHATGVIQLKEAEPETVHVLAVAKEHDTTDAVLTISDSEAT